MDPLARVGIPSHFSQEFMEGSLEPDRVRIVTDCTKKIPVRIVPSGQDPSQVRSSTIPLEGNVSDPDEIHEGFGQVRLRTVRHLPDRSMRWIEQKNETRYRFRVVNRSIFSRRNAFCSK
jgi:hypothetical protein